MVRIRLIGLAVEGYRSAHGRFPDSLQAPIATVLPKLQQYATDTLIPTDLWGRPIQYLSSGTTYAIWSYGCNGQQDRFPGGGPHEGYDVDLVFSAGEFWQGHAGVAGYDARYGDPFERIEAEMNAAKAPRVDK